ncbi:MAG: EamA family transporter, partial [Planctomycetes bacterium]|nr:EamA family transporter [Planctomycetota bacterium]
MIYLLIVSFIWAFSFGLIKGNLVDLDSNFVACVRMALAFVVFLPFTRLKGLNRGLVLFFVLVGAIQFGVMYAAYIYAYWFLPAHQVALYTIFTPLYVSLIHDGFERRFEIKRITTSILAILGAYIILHGDLHRFEFQAGFLLLQLSNICFALGQVLYRRKMCCHKSLKDLHVFGLLYLGAMVVTAAGAGWTMDWAQVHLTWKQCSTLLYLGLLASGLGFFLWNYGARRSEPGALAILNNLKIPLAVACSIL